MFVHRVRSRCAIYWAGRRRSSSILVAPVFALLLLLVASVARADLALSPPQFDARLSLGTNDNIGQAEFGRDIVDDRFAEIIAGAGYRLTMFNGWLDASGRGFLRARQFSEIKGLGHVGGGLELGLEGRLTGSSLPPFYRVLIRAEGEDYDFKQRDSTIYTGNLTFGTNLVGPQLVVMIGGEYRDRRARSDVFDLAEWSAFLDAGFAFADTWHLGARTTYIDGDVWSTVQAVLPDGQGVDDIFDLVAASEVIQRDDAFNDELDGLWFAYRLPATSTLYSLNLTRNLNERFSVGLQWVEIRVKAKRDNDYDNRLLQLSFDLKF